MNEHSASGETSSLSFATISDILSHPYRRTVVEVLSAHDRPVSLSELAVEVADRERTDQEYGPVLDGLKRIQLKLYHNHLPRLADHGLITFDSERRTIKARSEIEHLTSNLDQATGSS